jgi:mannose-6-phosphate isomerase-like protein (cupin superfamily)
MEKVNLIEAFGTIGEQWSPRLAGMVNDCAVKLAKLEGEFIWHHHEAEDELFLVVKGSLAIELREKTITLNEGEFMIVPRGVEHRPVAREEAWILLFEPAATLNTGNIRNERTVEKNLRLTSND